MSHYWHTMKSPNLTKCLHYHYHTMRVTEHNKSVHLVSAYHVFAVFCYDHNAVWYIEFWKAPCVFCSNGWVYLQSFLHLFSTVMYMYVPQKFDSLKRRPTYTLFSTTIYCFCVFVNDCLTTLTLYQMDKYMQRFGISKRNLPRVLFFTVHLHAK